MIRNPNHRDVGDAKIVWLLRRNSVPESSESPLRRSRDLQAMRGLERGIYFFLRQDRKRRFIMIRTLVDRRYRRGGGAIRGEPILKNPNNYRIAE